MTRPLRPAVLRAYDIRGVAGDELTEEDFFSIGRAFAAEMHAAGAKTAAVGYDGRLSSPGFEAALVEGLTRSGADVLRVGRGPSPMLYFATHTQGADAGLMITGSHNPPEFNGIKMTLHGKAFFGDDIAHIGARIAAADFQDGQGTARTIDVFDAYVDRLAANFAGGKALNVVWDPGNGAAGEVTRALAARLPGRHTVINGDIDGTFPAHHPDPTIEANLAQLRAEVAKQGADIGIALDGDGDRIGVIDAEGRVIWGDQLLIILARDVLKALPGATILCDVKASRAFFDEIRRLGGKPVMWKAGHSHIKSKMAEIGAPLAGEMSAHIFFKHRYYGYDDALYAAVRLLSMLASGPDSAADLLDSLPHFVNTPEIRFPCPDDRKFDVMADIARSLKAAPGTEIVDLDGVRVETAEGWWLLRASNTQPMLTVRCEATEQAGLDDMLAAVRRVLADHGITTDAIHARPNS